MQNKIYKYFSAEAFDHVFQQKSYCGIKCSFPKDYNDPFELFLGVDLEAETHLLATYQDVIQEIPQYLTSCFSKSPIVTPMWAHYAGNQSGFALEFDIARLENAFEDAIIKDITYRDSPDEGLKETLAYAAGTRKPRHAVFLQRHALNAAYFSKYSEWSYEQECRLVGINDYVQKVSENDILYVPEDCVTSIILGTKFVDHSKAEKIASDYNLSTYNLSIGKSYMKPFMTAQNGTAVIHHNGEICQSSFNCSTCSEPLIDDGELCPWCRITPDHKNQAARSNPLRILDEVGHLPEYMEKISEIHKNRKK